MNFYWKRGGKNLDAKNESKTKNLCCGKPKVSAQVRPVRYIVTRQLAEENV